ncbi:MAG: hypothetical protein CMP48_04925 [Rickettsiales bacterium]|nr:hypothetical protein [Rickettsiales bacterium]
MITDLHPDTYRIVITDETSGCISATASATVQTDGITPVLTAAVTDNTNCSGGNGTISITIVDSEGTTRDLSDYDFDWYTGAGTTAANRFVTASTGDNTTSAGGDEQTGLEPGFYTIVATATVSPGNGCFDQIIVEVQDNPDVLAIPVSGTDQSTDVTNCSPDNGQIIIDGIRLNGADITDEATLATYSFELFDSDDNSLGAFDNPGSATAGDFPSTSADLEIGTYFVRVTNSTTGCTSSPRAIVIDDVFEKPELSIVVNRTNSACDPAAADGELELTIEGPDNDANYTVQWFYGVVTSGSAEALTSGSAASDGFTPTITTTGTAPNMTSTISGLMDGSYYAVVTDNTDPNNTCSSNIAKTVLQDTTYLIDLTLTVTSEQTECDANGTVQITTVELTNQDGTTSIDGSGGVAAVLAVYDLELLDEDQVFVRNITSDADLTDLSEGDYFIQATHQGTSCESLPFGFRIEEEIVYPVGTAVVTANTSCETTGNGSIELTLTTDGVDNGYTVDWRDGELPTSPDLTGATETIAGNVFTASVLSTGTYTAVVTDNTSGCTVNFTYEILDQRVFPVMNIPSGQIKSDTICSEPGNGAITINASNIRIDGVAQTDLSLFNWTITSQNGSDIDGNASPYSPVLTGSTVTFSNMSADVYTIDVETIATGCSSNTFTVEVLDESSNPNLGDITVVPNGNCDGGSTSQGSVEILEIDGAAPSSGNYTYQWYVGNNTSGDSVSVAYPGTTDNDYIISGLVDGNYTVVVVDNNTSCRTTQVVTVTNDPVFPLITSYEVNNNLFCNTPNGSFSLVQIEYDGTLLNLADSTDSVTFITNFEIIVVDGNSAVVTDSDSSTPFDIDGLEEAGNPYSITITRTSDSNCDSESLSFNITDNPLDPVLQIVQVQADSTCTASATANGILRVIPDNQSDPGTDYNYAWTDSNGDPVGTNNDSLVNVLAGTYSVEVEHILSGCISDASFTLQNVPSSPRIVEFDTVHVTTCVPSNGVFEIIRMSNAPLSEFTFAFYDEDPTAGTPSPIQDSTSPILSSSATPSYEVAPGDYYAQATHTSTGCVSNVIQVTIEDNSIRPEVALDAFTLQSNCDPANPNGTLTVTADGSQDLSLYSFEWRDESGTVVEANNFTADSLAAGDYDVTVTILATGCSTTETFTMVDDYPDPLQISVSSEGNSRCIPDYNGQLAATVINIPEGKALSGYQFYWFDGDQKQALRNGSLVPTDADHIGTLYTQLDSGNYTLMVIDGTDVFCVSDTIVARVRNLRDEPDFRVDIVNQVTICDPERVNGRAAIGYTENDIFRYTFNWYAGTGADTVNIGSGSEMDSLAVGVYTVILNDVITGCESTLEFNMEDATVIPPAPSVTILQHRTNCSEPDGRALARVNGESDGYLFEWFLEGDLNNPVFTGSEVTQLDSITYIVRATDTETGCESLLQTITIENNIEDPVYEIRTSASICLRSEDNSIQLFNGTAEIVFEEFHTIDDITWVGPNGTVIEDQVKLVNAEPGIWSVTFTPDNGCEYTAELEIDATLKVYNGVSANGDGRNDFFIIDCIEYFPNNKVTIYNRDGSLVWENKGYDNIDVRFEGYSNVGRSGLRLPPGTYFYFIDKGDGTDKMQGYLELVR